MELIQRTGLKGNSEMTTALTSALVSGGVSVIVALASGVFTAWNRRKTDSSQVEMQRRTGDLSKELEQLKATLSHGQIVNSTQWNAEFGAYQAIWKEMVAVRTRTDKLVHREEELSKLGIPDEFLNSSDRVKALMGLTTKLFEAAESLLLAIHENAPFYPAAIREAANSTHVHLRALMDRQLGALSKPGETIAIVRSERFTQECETIVRTVFEGVDQVELLIRERLAAVQVRDGPRT